MQHQEPQLSMDRMPPEIVLRILSFVRHDDYFSIRLTCRRFNQLSKKPELWTKVELLFPRTMEQMYQLALEQFPSVGGKMRSLTITGFHTVPMIDDNEHLPPRLFERNSDDQTEPSTLNAEILGIIKTYCTGLKSLIIRNCRLRFQHDSHTYLPDSLSKLEFYGCRLPELPSNWMGQMATGRVTHTLNNLTTLKFERCMHVDTDFLRYLRACPVIKNFSLKGSLLAFVAPHPLVPADPAYPIDIWGQLGSLDISGTGRFPVLIHTRVLNLQGCQVKHLFMEKCGLIPSSVHDHMKVEFVSVAGYRPSVRHRNAFDDIDAWASIPSLKEMNASGCELTQAQRDELVRRHPNVLLNVNVEFEESPRIHD